MTQQRTRPGLLSRIEGRDAALAVIKDSANAFFLVAAIQAVVAVLVSPFVWIDAALTAVLAGLLRALESRTVAVLLSALALWSIVPTALNRIGVWDSGGSNIFLALFMTWVAVRAVQATFLLHGRFAPMGEPPSEE